MNNSGMAIYSGLPKTSAPRKGLYGGKSFRMAYIYTVFTTTNPSDPPLMLSHLKTKPAMLLFVLAPDRVNFNQKNVLVIRQQRAEKK